MPKDNQEPGVIEFSPDVQGIDLSEFDGQTEPIEELTNPLITP